ncbi:MAG: hypothetical protein ABL949_02060 [Fimbriimonadaceae bacterium]
MPYATIKIFCGVIATIGLYSVLYKENKFYRFFEHMFLGLAGGWMLVTLWTESLKEAWWDAMWGRVSDGANPVIEQNGNYLWAILLPIGAMGYFVVSKKHAWMSRIPIGIIIGLWSGQQFSAWLKKYGPQLQASMSPIAPTNAESFFRPIPADPADLAEISKYTYGSQAVVNFIALVTLLCVLSYFLFSINFKAKSMNAMTKMGRYLLMIGFGAIFGSTVMMRFSLLIDRMYFIFIEFFKNTLFHIN